MVIMMMIVMSPCSYRPARGNGLPLTLESPLRNHWRGDFFFLRQTINLFFLRRLYRQPAHPAKLVTLSIPISANATKSDGTPPGTLFLQLFRDVILNISSRRKPLHHLKGGRHRILTGLWTSHLRF